MTFPGVRDIQRHIGRREPEIIAWAKALIRFPSENRPPDGAEAEVQQFIAGECKGLGGSVDMFSPSEVPGIESHPGWLKGRRYEMGRKNVVARWKGSGTGRSLLLSGHADVAPFEPDDWRICRPYEPVVKDGRLYGRGSADMKGGLAAAFWAIRILRELDYQPAGDVLFESLVDEEFAGGNGTLAARLKGYHADLALIPEPTQMEICPACFGAFLGTLVVKGQAGMPYTGSEIANPIRGAARAVELFREWEKAWRMENHHLLFDGPGKALKVLLWKLGTETHGEFTQMGTPPRVRMSWIVWCHPGTSPVEFYSRFRSFWQEQMAKDPALKPFDVTIEPDYHFVKPWDTPLDEAGVREVIRACHAVGDPLTVGGAPFSCDLGIYGEIGEMPCVLLGPRGDRLHAPDEWVSVDDLLRLTGIFSRLIVQWCTPALP